MELELMFVSRKMRLNTSPAGVLTKHNNESMRFLNKVKVRTSITRTCSKCSSAPAGVTMRNFPKWGILMLCSMSQTYSDNSLLDDFTEINPKVYIPLLIYIIMEFKKNVF